MSNAPDTDRMLAAQYGEPIDAAPFVAWLHAELDKLRAADTFASDDTPIAVDEMLADRLGTTTRALYRYKRSLDSQSRPTETFRRNPVEDMLDRAGVSIYTLYPELEAADDVELEPDAYCDSCHDVVTPIAGRCPWCERPTQVKVPDRRYCPREDAMRYAANDGNCWRCGGKLKRQSPMAECACGCGTKIRRFSARTGREVKYVTGHAPRSLERKIELPAEPFALWLENELQNLDPIQALARRTGMGRDFLLDVLGRRVETIEMSRVRNAMWRAAREGQGGGATRGSMKGMPPRPGALKVRDIYPEFIRSTTCPSCGGKKSPHGEMCRGCRRRQGKPRQQNRPSSVTPELVLEARRLREVEGLAFGKIAKRLQPRTRCTNPDSVKQQLLVEFRKHGWDTSRVGRERAAA